MCFSSTGFLPFTMRSMRRCFFAVTYTLRSLHVYVILSRVRSGIDPELISSRHTATSGVLDPFLPPPDESWVSWWLRRFYHHIIYARTRTTIGINFIARKHTLTHSQYTSEIEYLWNRWTQYILKKKLSYGKWTGLILRLNLVSLVEGKPCECSETWEGFVRGTTPLYCFLYKTKICDTYSLCHLYPNDVNM